MELQVKDICFLRNKHYTMQNEITLNSNRVDTSFFDDHEFVEITSSKGSMICMISYSSDDSDIHAYVSPPLKEISDGDKFIIKKISHVNLKRYFITKVENVKIDKVEVSQNIIDSVSRDGELDGIVLLNKLNGYSLKLPMDKILVDAHSVDKVRLSIKHRKLLEIDLPTYISQMYLDSLDGSLDQYYQDESKNITYENYYEAAKKLKYHLEKKEIDFLSVYPMYTEKRKRSLLEGITELVKKGKEKALSFFIGQKSIDLRVIRPYPIDESENAIRLSETAMKLLGLEETDTVTIRNGKYSCKARVLSIDDWCIVTNENRIKSQQDINLLIGLPTYMRRELDLPYINTNVSVERDLGYFFRKHSNNQIMTIIGLILSLTVVNEIANIYVRILSIIALIILFMYLSFSEVREKISHK
ncbi:hypothetical protein SAMN05660297_00561 [Natronincola peptidivorans]|uniref:Uncharacterized protein n=1 Tax=Natronincola peptidivorans TaxID=426128 RepID=A0A1H9ZJH2_9FIRM|nr:hypothetical protein [Natronincola peptidivorans]SES81262.1 hypothetical protein SAMN05660297_00561 [Natronincola peptidivorans]